MKCGKLNKRWRKKCIKKVKHRGYHKIEIPHTGTIRRTYHATHVVLWK